MAQEIKKIPLSELVLWSETPRELIGDLRGRARGKANQDIADRAFGSNGDDSLGWKMESLCRQMAKEDKYHLNELPTVCYEDGVPVVYDGNRRVLIGMLVHWIVTSPDPKYEVYKEKINFPYELDCNVCDRETALKIVNRMHADNRTWGILERDIFKSKYMKEKKSAFLIIEEATYIISRNPKLNRRFVKEEVLNPRNLPDIGFNTKNGVLEHCYSTDEDAKKILNRMVEAIERTEITTREQRGKLAEVLKRENTSRQLLQTIQDKADRVYRPMEKPSKKRKI